MIHTSPAAPKRNMVSSYSAQAPYLWIQPKIYPPNHAYIPVPYNPISYWVAQVSVIYDQLVKTYSVIMSVWFIVNYLGDLLCIS